MFDFGNMFTFLPPKDFQAASLESSPAPWSTHQGHHSLLDTFGSLPWIHRLAAKEKEKKNSFLSIMNNSIIQDFPTLKLIIKNRYVDRLLNLDTLALV